MEPISILLGLEVANQLAMLALVAITFYLALKMPPSDK